MNTETTTTELNIEGKINEFLKGKTGEVRLNDFLKSIWGVPERNSPPKWKIQENSKKMKLVLDKMCRNGLTLSGITYQKLGKSYYSPENGKQLHYTIDNFPIIAIM